MGGAATPPPPAAWPPLPLPRPRASDSSEPVVESSVVDVPALHALSTATKSPAVAAKPKSLIIVDISSRATVGAARVDENPTLVPPSKIHGLAVELAAA
jgi:hypothetical protein